MDTRILVQKMMPKFYEYSMSEELSVNKNTPQIIVGKNEEYLYFHNNYNRMHSLLAKAILLERIGAMFIIYQNMVAGKEITDDFDVLNWFQIKQTRLPMMTQFTYIIHSITLLKTEIKQTYNLQTSILNRFVLISLLKCSLICFS